MLIPNTIDCPYPTPLAASLEIPSPITSSTSSGNSGVSGCPGQDAPKKKRSRVTKEQLAHLERLFATDCSPTTTRRREISLQIGMPERQIQIWFQNRRAKAKSAVDRNKTRWIVSPLVRPPELSQAVQAEFAALIQEDDPIIFVIPCTYLTIGGWNRVGDSNWDLLAWICETKRCLTWFVQSKEHSFKMQVPLDCVVELDFKNVNPGRGILALSISQCPRFFSRRDIPLPGGALPSYWKACGDWTENREASLSLWHALEGPALPLAYIIGYIKDRITPITKPVDRQPPSRPMTQYPPSSTTGIGPASSSLSPSLIPQGPLYSSAQTPSPDCHLSPLFPGLAELFPAPKYSQ